MPALGDLELLGVVITGNARLRRLISRVERCVIGQNTVRCQEEIEKLRRSSEALNSAFAQYLKTLEEETLEAVTLDESFEVIDTSFSDATRVIENTSYMLCKSNSGENHDNSCSPCDDEFLSMNLAKSEK